ncbi:MAG TPA: DUF2306 domain-containing protein [Puia sp.]|jgi:hypothetical protein|nr:DUF2306 domain-containing protein [Puia sp.]
MKPSLVIRVLLLSMLAFFSFLMIRLSLPYTAVRDDVEFLQTKQLVYHIGYWRHSFYIHVFTSSLTLIAGFTQFNPWLLRRWRRVHRYMGWAYGITVVCISGPAAFIMAWYANGGLPARASFTLLSLLWVVFTCCAVYFAVRKRFDLHGDFMFRSYALTLSALTLRSYTYLIALSNIPASPRDVYITTAWLSWVPNLIIAEILIRTGWPERLLKGWRSASF